MTLATRIFDMVSPISVLAFDFGMKHIGIAVGQTQTHSASALTTVSATSGKPDWKTLDTVIEVWRPDLLIVGLPINMDGSDSEMAEHARRFANRLNAHYQRPVEFMDERLTSYEARQLEPRVDKRHALAARLIAETWLNTQAES